MSDHVHSTGMGAQASGSTQHGSFLAGTVEMLENKLNVQTAEMEKLVIENHKLASSHGVLKLELSHAEAKMQGLRAHLEHVKTTTDMEIRNFLRIMRLMEADIRNGDEVKKELHQVRMETERLIAQNQKLTMDIEHVNRELKKLSPSGGNKSLSELVSELEGLQKEHHSLRSQLEFEKNTNMKQVAQMRVMEMNLTNMIIDAQRLRVEAANAGNEAHVAQAAAELVTALQRREAQDAVSSEATNSSDSYVSHQQEAQAGAQQQEVQAQQGALAEAYTYPTVYDPAYQMHAVAPTFGFEFDPVPALQTHAAQANAYAGYSGYYYPTAAASYSTQQGYPAAAYAVTAPLHPAATGAAAMDVARPYVTVRSSNGVLRLAMPLLPLPLEPSPDTHDLPRAGM
ncbi:hypothetical protein ACP4OV_006400 [Aristida adscensionis]